MSHSPHDQDFAREDESREAAEGSDRAMETELAALARRILRVPTLAGRNSDRLDFHEVSVWDLKQALVEAYRAGQRSVR